MKPQQKQSPHSTRMIAACKLLDDNPAISLATLAEKLGLSQFHFHRVFKSVMGLTPKQYANAVRMRMVKESLQRNINVTDAIYAAGFNTPSRFYAQAGDAMGMKPSLYKHGGAGQHLRYAVADCKLGKLTVALTQKGIAAILLGDTVDAVLSELHQIFPHADVVAGESDLGDLLAKVVELVDYPTRSIELPLDIQGTVFQQRVWALLRSIPPGKTLSYSALAQQLGAPKAVRAVASACAANKLAVAIPCHRAVRSDGSLAGYRWGLHRKKTLLDNESE